jgi:hypothetical protein
MRITRRTFTGILFIFISITLFASCGQTALPGFNEVVGKGGMPIEYRGMKKSVSPAQTAYEISLKNMTGDTIISFDYTMVRMENDIFSGYEEKSFGGNYTVAPGEEFDILSRIDTDAPEFKFLLKSASWRETSTGALFRWENKGYDEELRQLRLKGN